jgi:hypothetical protein
MINWKEIDSNISGQFGYEHRLPKCGSFSGLNPRKENINEADGSMQVMMRDECRVSIQDCRAEKHGRRRT